MTLGLVLLLAGVAHAGTVTPPPSAAYLPNPGIGFQAMHQLDDPVLPETVAYRRPQYGWSDQNPAPGVFDWSAVDADLAAARAAGKQLSFRIYTMRGESYGGHKVPAWVLAEGAILIRGREPRYSNCVYQQRWGEFVEALRARYDGNPDIAFIDISGYGNFNEWSWHEQTEWDMDFMNPTTLDGMARRRLADMFIGGAGTIQCRLANGATQSVSYAYPGFQHTQLVMPYAGIQQSTRYVAARRPDVGFRHDCLGSPQHTNAMLATVGDVIAGIWRQAPVVYELCGPENLASAKDVLERTHGSLVHENNGGNDVETLRATLRDAGYRFTLVNATVPDVSFPDGSLTVAMTWRNVGLAPAYARTGQDLALRFYLVDAGGTPAASWTLAADPNAWMPAEPIGTTPPDEIVTAALPLPPGLHLAQYTAAVGIVEVRTGRHVRLANTGTDGQDRLPLGTIRFSDGSVCGDGLRRPDLGEECDDGNTVGGDCCGPTCRIETGSCDDGNACTLDDTCVGGTCVGGPPRLCDDGAACTRDACDPTLGCVSTPDDARCADDGDLCTRERCDPVTLMCETLTTPRPLCGDGTSAGLLLSDRGDRRRLRWVWKNGTISRAQLGDPVSARDTGYAVCVYDGERLAMSANVPASLTCDAGRSCWSLRSGTLRFLRPDAQPEGIAAMRFRVGRPGRDGMAIAGRNAPLRLPDPASPDAMFDPAGPVVVQAVTSAGGCWGARFDAASIRTNRPDLFRATVR